MISSHYTIIHLYNKIHDPPLMPLEKEDKSSVKGDNKDEINVEKPSSSAPPPIEQILSGGITYSISHVSYFNPRVPKSEGTAFNMAPAVSDNDKIDENSNCSSYTAGSSFTLWDESSSSKGKAGKENSGDLHVTKESTLRTRQWPVEQPSDSFSHHLHSFSSPSSSQPPAQNKKSFIQMLKCANVPYAKEEDDDKVFTLRKDGNSQSGELQVKVDGRASNHQKPNTPRSKHSATEQRRRCKINDRFQTLREIIPHTDQKRDKASFLLEVIEYIQFLQEKVSRYEGYPGCYSERTKLTPWGSSPKLAENFVNPPRAVNGPVLMLKPDDENNVINSNLLRKQQNPAEPDINNPICFKAMDQQTGLMNKAPSIPIPQLKADILPSLRNYGAVINPACRLAASDRDNVSLPQIWHSRSSSSVFNSMTNNQELALEGGNISISRIYSQGLLNTLTQALKSSGVDVSHASISVQVDIGKQTNPAQSAQLPSQDFDINCDNHTLVRERVDTSSLEESDHTAKKLKTLKS